MWSAIIWRLFRSLHKFLRNIFYSMIIQYIKLNEGITWILANIDNFKYRYSVVNRAQDLQNMECLLLPLYGQYSEICANIDNIWYGYFLFYYNPFCWKIVKTSHIARYGYMATLNSEPRSSSNVCANFRALSQIVEGRKS